ncbi:hypothetical protein AR505_1258 [methanogenic archaeon ISO4-H5]|nr:hypothetical protein AR505_1258 [methanogenic archaeon ISO4-H5]
MTKGHAPSLTKQMRKNAKDISIPEGLTPEEREQYLRMNGMASDDKPKTDDQTDQTVSKVKYDEDIAELKEKLDKKTDKVNELNKDRENLRKERDSNKEHWDSARSDLEEEQKKTANLREELRKMTDERDSLRNEVKRLNSQTVNVTVPENESETKTKLKKSEKAFRELSEKYDALQSDYSRAKLEKESLDATITRLNETIKGFDDERARFEDTLALKDSEIENLKNRPELTQEQTSGLQTGLLVRKSINQLYSDMLDDGRYDIKLARDGTNMLIIPNVEGGAVCVNHSIILPRLGDLIPFAGEVSYELVPAGNNVLRADLK